MIAASNRTPSQASQFCTLNTSSSLLGRESASRGDDTTGVGSSPTTPTIRPVPPTSYVPPSTGGVAAGCRDDHEDQSDVRRTTCSKEGVGVGERFDTSRLGKLYIVGRRDLPPGLRAAQMLHAARQFADQYPDQEGRWFRESNTIVLLEVPDEPALQDFASRADASGVESSEFSEEPDLGLTALALGSSARRLVSSLPLALK